MNELFTAVVNMSITGSFVILAVLGARLCLKKAPKRFAYALWAVVLFRLLCPVSLASPISPLPVQNAGTGTMEYVALVPGPTGSAWEPVFYHGGQASPPPASAETPMEPLAALWLTGAAVLLGVNLGLLRRWRARLTGAVLLEGRAYLADGIRTPFVLGVLQPKIYLPAGLSREERDYILLHEHHHIRRLDHITRLLAFGALCLHWFNPLVWLAYGLSERDMEMSCDEAVLGRLQEDIRADYSYTLLRMATGRRFVPGTPLAFGEGDTKERVKNIMKFRKPTMFVAAFCLVLCIALTACLSVNPESTETTSPTETVPEETTHPLASYGEPISLKTEMCQPMELTAMTQEGVELLYADDGYRIIFYCYDTNQLFGYDFVEDKVFLAISLYRTLGTGAVMPTPEQRGLIFISQDGNTILLHDWKDNVYRRTFKLDLASFTYQVKEGYDALDDPFVLPDDHEGQFLLGPALEALRYTSNWMDYFYIFRNNAVTYDGPGRLEDICMTAINLDTLTELGFELAYEDEDTIIFYGYAGLFGYDLNWEKLAFAIDIKQLMGTEAGFQGTARMTTVCASRDGKFLLLSDCSEGNRGMTVVHKTALLDLENGTYEIDDTYRVYDSYTGQTDLGEDTFEVFDEHGDRATQGYMMSGMELGTTCYVRGELQWYCFR